MIDIREIDRIKNEIVPIIAQRIQLRKSGANWVGRCCWHDDRHPSFSVSEKKRRWACFVCNLSGDSIDFIAKFHGTDFRGALAILGITDDDRDPERSRQVMKALDEIQRDANALLRRLDERGDHLCFFSRHVNWMINHAPFEERQAAWYEWERWADNEFEKIENDRERIHEIARRHRREVSEWVNQSSR